MKHILEAADNERYDSLVHQLGDYWNMKGNGAKLSREIVEAMQFCYADLKSHELKRSSCRPTDPVVNLAVSKSDSPPDCEQIWQQIELQNKFALRRLLAITEVT